MATSKSSSKQSGKPSGKDNQGFAGMDEDKRKQAASKGGSSKQEDAKSQVDHTEADGDESQELDELLSILESGNLTELDSDTAVELIDEWHEILSESEESGLKEIGKGLKQLKKSLSASKSKPDEIAEALSNLGEKTEDYANNAPRGYKTKLHTLGKALSNAGKSLTQQD